MTYASTDDVAALAARDLTGEEQALVERRLAQVERMILRRIPNLDDRVTAGDLDQGDVADIESEAVLRLLRNPDGLHSETDGTYSHQFGRETTSGRLEILPREWEILGIRPITMFSIAPRFGSSDEPARS